MSEKCVSKSYFNSNIEVQSCPDLDITLYRKHLCLEKIPANITRVFFKICFSIKMRIM